MKLHDSLMIDNDFPVTNFDDTHASFLEIVNHLFWSLMGLK